MRISEEESFPLALEGGGVFIILNDLFCQGQF